jgi:hypothetical protein
MSITTDTASRVNEITNAMPARLRNLLDRILPVSNLFNYTPLLTLPAVESACRWAGGAAFPHVVHFTFRTFG